MIVPSGRILLGIARFHLRPARRWFECLQSPDRPKMWGLRLGPVEVCGRRIVLRSPRIADAAAWREIRLRERAHLERWWATSEFSWEERHTDAAWVSSMLHARQEARAGRALPLVVEIDGELVGQFNLERVERHARSAELGIWLDSAVLADTVVTGVAAAIFFDYAILGLGLYRLTAPIADGNRAAAWSVQRAGLVHEGRMTGFLDVGGVRTDHHLWALTADRMPPGGMVKSRLQFALDHRPPRRRTGADQREGASTVLAGGTGRCTDAHLEPPSAVGPAGTES
jgi:RimJ/RimL family protein N-acetyltransferase